MADDNNNDWDSEEPNEEYLIEEERAEEQNTAPSQMRKPSMRSRVLEQQRARLAPNRTSGMSIRFKIVGSLVLLLIMIATITITSWYYLNDLSTSYIAKINATSIKLGDIDAKLARLAERIRADVLTGRQFEKNFVINEEEAAIKQLDAIIIKIRTASKEGEELAKEGDITGAEQIFSDVNESVDNYERTFRQTEKNVKSARKTINENEIRIGDARKELIGIITKNIEATRSLSADYWIATKAEAEARQKQQSRMDGKAVSSDTDIEIITVSELVDIGRQLEALDKEQLMVRVNLERYIASRANIDAEAARSNLSKVQEIAIQARTLANAILDPKLKEQVQLQSAAVKDTASEFSRRVEQVIADNIKNAASISKLKDGITKNINDLDKVGAQIKELTEKELIDLQWNTINDEAKASQDDGKAAVAAADSAAMIILIMGGLGTLIALLITILMPRPIMMGLSNLLNGAALIAEGDLTQEVDVRNSDELGQLGEMFNSMRENLFGLAERFQNASIQITSATNEILAASEKQFRSTNDQSAQVMEISSTLTEISSTSEQFTRNASRAQVQTNQASEGSSAGVESMQKTNQGMQRITQSNEATSDKINTLNEKVELIGQVMTAIAAVADQTNLLSLNAAIEASKAGEQGKGFAVVANEIRRLADQTILASQDIGNMIREVQTATNSAVMSMQKSSEDIKSGSNLVGEAEGVLGSVNSAIQGLAPQVQEISQGAVQQASSTVELSSSMFQLGTAIKQSISAAKQTQSSAYELNTMSTQLRDAVQQFKLK